MKKITRVLLGLSLASSGVLLAAAQEQQMQPSGPPQVLEVQREFLKPGKAGTIHDKSEANFVEAFSHAKWPTHYIAMNSLSGPSRALYLVGYPSYAAWEKDEDATQKNAALSAAVERASESDGELLSSSDQAVLYYNPDLSLHPVPSLAKVRFMEITVFKLHPGHGTDWHNLVKMYVADVQKAGITDSNWATYELEYGGADEYVLFSTDKSLADIDEGVGDGNKLRDAVGEDELKKLDDLEAAAVSSVDSELFEINPRQSYPPSEWVTENPSFWKPSAVMAATPKPASNPAKTVSAKKGGQ
jgi:hypothetical protein